jgi:hypothetical protein
MTETSSSSQSLRRLVTISKCVWDTKGRHFCDVLVHLFGLLDGLFAIAVGGGALLLGLFGSRWSILLYLVALVCHLDAHLAPNTGHAQAEVRVVEHVNSEIDRLGSEVDCEQGEHWESNWKVRGKIYQ